MLRVALRHWLPEAEERAAQLRLQAGEADEARVERVPRSRLQEVEMKSGLESQPAVMVCAARAAARIKTWRPSPAQLSAKFANATRTLKGMRSASAVRR